MCRRSPCRGLCQRMCFLFPLECPKWYLAPLSFIRLFHMKVQVKQNAQVIGLLTACSSNYMEQKLAIDNYTFLGCNPTAGEIRQDWSNHVLSKCLLAHRESGQHVLRAVSQLLLSCTKLEAKRCAAILYHIQPFLGFALLHKAPPGQPTAIPLTQKDEQHFNTYAWLLTY